MLKLAVSNKEVVLRASARKALLLGGGSGDRHDRWESSGMMHINWVLLIQSPTNLLLQVLPIYRTQLPLDRIYCNAPQLLQYIPGIFRH